jgi:hypothetical protein
MTLVMPLAHRKETILITQACLAIRWNAPLAYALKVGNTSYRGERLSLQRVPHMLDRSDYILRGTSHKSMMDDGAESIARLDPNRLINRGHQSYRPFCRVEVGSAIGYPTLANSTRTGDKP